MTMTAISGNTFPVKAMLKSLRATWDKDAKVWMVPSDKAEEAQRIVRNAPAREKRELSRTDIITIAVRKRGGTPGVCASCGNKCKFPYDECLDCKEEREMGY